MYQTNERVLIKAVAKPAFEFEPDRIVLITQNVDWPDGPVSWKGRVPKCECFSRVDAIKPEAVLRAASNTEPSILIFGHVVAGPMLNSRYYVRVAGRTFVVEERHLLKVSEEQFARINNSYYKLLEDWAGLAGTDAVVELTRQWMKEPRVL